MIKTLILDFGGVLFPQPYINNIKPKEEKFRQIKQLVIDIYTNNELLIKQKGFTKEDFLKLVKEKGKILFTKEELSLITQSILQINQEMFTFIKNASQKHNLYALINEAPRWTELRAYFYNLNLFFKDYFISSYLGVQKPAPQIFKIFLETTGLKPSECLFVDDVKENTDTASELGFNTTSPQSLINSNLI